MCMMRLLWQSAMQRDGVERHMDPLVICDVSEHTVPIVYLL